MKKAYIRWLAAYAGRQHSLSASIRFEMGRKDEAACEPVRKDSNVARKGQIGLLLKEEAIFRTFNSDCWSYYGGVRRKDQHPARLYTDEPNRKSNHGEAWAHMEDSVCGIVVYGMNLWQLTQERRNTILNAAAKWGLPVYRLTHGVLQKEDI